MSLSLLRLLLYIVVMSISHISTCVLYSPPASLLGALVLFLRSFVICRCLFLCLFLFPDGQAKRRSGGRTSGNGQTGGWTDIRTDRQAGGTNTWADERTNMRTDRRADARTNQRTEIQTDGANARNEPAGGRTDGRPYRRANGQTERADGRTNGQNGWADGPNRRTGGREKW